MQMTLKLFSIYKV